MVLVCSERAASGHVQSRLQAGAPGGGKQRKRGLSLNVLAQKAGWSRQTVSYVEQEVQNPTLDTLLRIAAVLEVDLEIIIAKARKTASKRQE